MQICITFGSVTCVPSLRHVYVQCELGGTLIRPDVTRQNAIKKMFVFSFYWWMWTPLRMLLSVCAFESPGLRALDCGWLLRPPTAPSSALNLSPTTRARGQRCFPRTSAGTVPSCCSKKSIGYVLRFCRSGRGAIRKQFFVCHFYSLATFFLS